MPPIRLLILFFGSGICGLVYEVVWMRALTLTLSVSVYAVSTVLCAFMGGLALGAGIAGRVADRLKRPLLAFGLAEVGVGLTGLLSLGMLFDLGPVYAWFHAGLGGEGAAFLVARFLLACAVLLVPCTLMGTTLPLLSRAVIEGEDVVGRGAGGLYAINTLGAVVGCIAAGFALIPSLGLRSTTAVAATLNLAIGLSAVALGRRAVRVPSAGPAVAVSAAPQLPRAAALTALAFGISGFTAMGYEVLWTRALEQFTHNSTYAYTAMLAVFLLGIGAGSAAAAALADRVRRPIAWFGALELGIGISVIGALLVYMRLLHWIPTAAAALGGIGSWSRALALIFGVAVMTLLATALLFGATFPFVARSVVESVDAVGRRIAGAYTLNTVGSILGAVAVGFLILPAIGMRGSFVALIGINLAVGALLVVAVAPRAAAAAAGTFAAAALGTALVLIPPRLFEEVFRERYGELLLYREQVTDIVMVTHNQQGRLIRFGDGRGTAGTVTYREDRTYAHVALLPHPQPRRVLNICFGVGNSLSSVAQYPVERIDQVELSPGVVYAAPFFRETNREVLEDPRVHLEIQDGRNFLLTSRERYDVIRLDPPELHTAGIVNLYTQEFFELARDHLAPGGIFSIWINIAYTPEPEVKMVVRTAAEVFPHVTVWHGPWLYSWVINGSVEPRPPDMALLMKHFSKPAVRADLETIPIRTPFEFLNHFVMAGDEVWDFVGDAPLITDDHTRLDFSVPRSHDSFFGISNSITDYYLVDLMDPEAKRVIDRAARYCRHKQPVFPHLRNPAAAGLEPEEVRERLESLLGSFPHGGCVGKAQAQAARLRR
jgi:spermidine synthase